MITNKATVSLGQNAKGEWIRWVKSPAYNYAFNVTSGFFQRWGETQEDDPTWSPFGPEIMDIEISDGESCPMTCAFCSPKGTLVNTPNGKIPIENLVSTDLVIGYDVEKNSPQIQEIEEVYSRQYNGDLICIELDNGSILKLTPDHEIYTKNRGWIVSKNLSITDEIISF